MVYTLIAYIYFLSSIWVIFLFVSFIIPILSKKALIFYKVESLFPRLEVLFLYKKSYPAFCGNPHILNLQQPLKYLFGDIYSWHVFGCDFSLISN